mmetsp:Transcript_28197/g.73923  ORF Transcript_28197/g.73923 Transcript_28197/m.73923 type:complete len:223 (+) Transcript_28197:4822-5490(+)
MNPKVLEHAEVMNQVSWERLKKVVTKVQVLERREIFECAGWDHCELIAVEVEVLEGALCQIERIIEQRAMDHIDSIERKIDVRRVREELACISLVGREITSVVIVREADFTPPRDIDYIHPRHIARIRIQPSGICPRDIARVVRIQPRAVLRRHVVDPCGQKHSTQKAMCRVADSPHRFRCVGPHRMWPESTVALTTMTSSIHTDAMRLGRSTQRTAAAAPS